MTAYVHQEHSTEIGSLNCTHLKRDISIISFKQIIEFQYQPYSMNAPKISNPKCTKATLVVQHTTKLNKDLFL